MYTNYVNKYSPLKSLYEQLTLLFLKLAWTNGSSLKQLLTNETLEAN